MSVLEAFLRFAGTVVDSCRQFRKRAVWNLLRSVGGVELGFCESGVDQHVVDLFHVGVVFVEGAVFVFNLDENDGAAIANL